jgi:hypothetical protein
LYAAMDMLKSLWTEACALLPAGQNFPGAHFQSTAGLGSCTFPTPFYLRWLCSWRPLPSPGGRWYSFSPRQSTSLPGAWSLKTDSHLHHQKRGTVETPPSGLWGTALWHKLFLGSSRGQKYDKWPEATQRHFGIKKTSNDDSHLQSQILRR